MPLDTLRTLFNNCDLDKRVRRNLPIAAAGEPGSWNARPDMTNRETRPWGYLSGKILGTINRNEMWFSILWLTKPFFRFVWFPRNMICFVLGWFMEIHMSRKGTGNKSKVFWENAHFPKKLKIWKRFGRFCSVCWVCDEKLQFTCTGCSMRFRIK